MTIGSTDSLVATLRASPLLDRSQLEELTHELQPRFPNPRDLVRELIQRGWLTPYQVNQLGQGRGQDLQRGAYVLLERLGAGGMGEVFKARHQNLHRIVALKLIRKELVANTEAVRRFQREIRAAAQLDHPNLVRAFDADSDGDAQFLVMEYVEGTDLARLVKETGPLPLAQACECIRQAALALQHAADKGLIHRDIKPSNLLLTPDGVLKVLDMGLARLNRTAVAGESVSTLTQEGSLVGTPDYIAPEQAFGAPDVDIRADLYSLGCTLYFLLTGRPPFPGRNLAVKLVQHQLEEPVPVEQLRPDVPPELVAVVRKLLAKRPAERYQTPADLAHVLAALPGLETTARGLIALPVEPGPDTVEAALPDTSLNAIEAAIVSQHRLQERAEARLWRVLVSTGAVVLLGSLALMGFLLSRPTPPPPPPLGPPIVQIAAGATWQDTGVDVPAGQLVIIRARGQWRKPGLSDCSAKGLESAARERTIVPDAPLMCLLGRVGNDDSLLVLGERRQLSLKQGGRLFVQANDLDVEENSGDLEIEIDGGNRQDHAVPPPGRSFYAGQPKELLAVLGERRHGWDHGEVLSVAFSPDSRSLACGCNSSMIRLWDTATMHEKANMGGPQVVRAVAFAPDGKTLAAARQDHTVQLWNVSVTPPQVRTVLKGHTHELRSVAFAPAGRMLVTGSLDCTARLWDLGAAEPVVRAVLALATEVHAVAFAPDGRTVAVGCQDHTVRLWDLSGEVPQLGAVLRGHTGAVYAVAFAPDSQMLASAGYDHTVRLWDLSQAEAKEQAILQGHTDRVTTVAFAPRGRLLASASWDQSIRLWELTGSEPKERAVLQGHAGEVHTVAFSADGQRLASGSRDRSLRLWDLSAPVPAERRARSGHSGPVLATAFSPDSQTLVSAGQDRTVRLWDLNGASPRQRAVLQSHTAEVAAVAFAPHGRALASGSWDRTVRLWDLTGPEPTEKAVLTGHESQVRAVAFAVDGRTLASGGADGVIRLWDLSGDRPRQHAVFTGHTNGVTSLAFAPNGQTLASGSSDHRLRLWDLTGAEPKEKANLAGDGFVFGAVFSPDGKTLACGDSSGMIRLWDLTGDEPVAQPGLSAGGWGYSVAFRPDSQVLVAVGSAGWVRVWNRTGGAMLHGWLLPGGPSRVAVSADGQRLATANSDGTIHLLRWPALLTLKKGPG